RPTSGRARASGAQRRPQLPSLAQPHRTGLAAAPVGLNAPQQSGALRARPLRRCPRPPPAGPHFVHASGAVLRPSAARASPLTGATRGAAVPRLQVPVGWHTCAGLTLRARSCAPDTSLEYGDSTPCYLPRYHVPPQALTPDILRFLTAFLPSHCGCHPARRHGGAARHRHSPPDSGALV